jgi:hypothetical protein
MQIQYKAFFQIYIHIETRQKYRWDSGLGIKRVKRCLGKLI